MNASTSNAAPLHEKDEVLRYIVEGTATATGTEFFKSLVVHLASALDVRYSWVCEFADRPTRVRTLAFCAGGEMIPNFEYDLAGAPCEKVYATGSLCLYREHLQNLFPLDKELITIEAQSYLGTPFTDSLGNVLGHLAVIDVKPMSGAQRDLSIFRIFAARARAEVERLRAEKVVQEKEEKLSSILDSAMDAIITFDENQTVSLFNDASEKIFGVSAKEVLGKSFDRFLTGNFRYLLNRYINELSTGENASHHLWIPEGLTALRSNKEEFPIEATVSHIHVNKQKLFTLILRDVNERAKAEGQIRRLQLQNMLLEEELRHQSSYGEIIGESPQLKAVIKNLERVAVTDSTVLLTGETGSGKEVFARTLHNMSKRKEQAMIKVNCAALPSSLVESELFGHEKGSFTGALARKKGRFEMADGGTLFLDEIGELPMETQAKILRVMQEHEFERVGGTETIRVDVRIIAATNRNLEMCVKQGTFREDLFYRLNVFPIHIPPLRERLEDIPLLINHLLQNIAKRVGRRDIGIAKDAMEKLKKYNWPGNVRELANVIERAVILCEGSIIAPEHIMLMPTDDRQAAETTEYATLAEAERNHILKILEKTNWVVGGSNGAAKFLGINRTTLISKMKKLNIEFKS